MWITHRNFEAQFGQPHCHLACRETTHPTWWSTAVWLVTLEDSQTFLFPKMLRIGPVALSSKMESFIDLRKCGWRSGSTWSTLPPRLFLRCVSKRCKFQMDGGWVTTFGSSASHTSFGRGFNLSGGDFDPRLWQTGKSPRLVVTKLAKGTGGRVSLFAWLRTGCHA